MKFLPEVCPRCGRKIDRILVREIRGRRYVYAVHRIKEGGKTVKKQCYLGPVDRFNRVLDYLEEILVVLRHSRHSLSEIPPERRETLRRLLQELLELL